MWHTIHQCKSSEQSKHNVHNAFASMWHIIYHASSKQTKPNQTKDNVTCFCFHVAYHSPCIIQAKQIQYHMLLLPWDIVFFPPSRFARNFLVYLNTTLELLSLNLYVGLKILNVSLFSLFIIKTFYSLGLIYLQPTNPNNTIPKHKCN